MSELKSFPKSGQTYVILSEGFSITLQEKESQRGDEKVRGEALHFGLGKALRIKLD